MRQDGYQPRPRIDGWSQAQVGREMGVSQMQVSRLIAGAFAQFRRPLRVA